ncbi:acyl-CoA thioesterase [Desulfomicrobium orale]|uniref:Acyl-CoA thioesterase n=1 Tax=Desulfomicrobium orale DSM 12838 TaxID=888061 RepID=A0A109W6I8_9BACT|nr:acyl-CoA thioesterase [Desulfomicrobium orale]AMD93708.1 acyl-CoA thioesterase [Desulfomicrobium orale DSM 12838]
MKILAPKPVSASRATLACFVQPENANLMGIVHGGFILHQIDSVAAVSAMRHVRGTAVTVSIDSMIFHLPVRIGELVTFMASVNFAGTTSLEVGVRVEAENLFTGEVRHTNSAYLTFVALNEDGKPTEVPELILETELDRDRNARARARRELRLKQRKHS